MKYTKRCLKGSTHRPSRPGSYHDAEGRPVLNMTGFPDVSAMVAKVSDDMRLY